MISDELRKQLETMDHTHPAMRAVNDYTRAVIAEGEHKARAVREFFQAIDAQQQGANDGDEPT